MKQKRDKIGMSNAKKNEIGLSHEVTYGKKG